MNNPHTEAESLSTVWEGSPNLPMPPTSQVPGGLSGPSMTMSTQEPRGIVTSSQLASLSSVLSNLSERPNRGHPSERTMAERAVRPDGQMAGGDPTSSTALPEVRQGTEVAVEVRRPSTQTPIPSGGPSSEPSDNPSDGRTTVRR